MAEKQAAQPQEAPANSGFFSFIPHPLAKKAVEIIASAIPGALILFIFIAGTSALNIFSYASSKNDVFAATYIPVVCLLPLVVGVIGPLVLERVRGETRLFMKSSVLVSFLSGFFGSLISALALVISSLLSADFKPFGDFVSDPLTIAGAAILLVIISSILSTIGGALIVAFLNRKVGK